MSDREDAACEPKETIGGAEDVNSAPIGGPEDVRAEPPPAPEVEVDQTSQEPAVEGQEVEEAEPPAVLVASESPAEPPAVESPTEPEAEPEVEEVPAPASDEEVKPKEVPKRVKVWSLAPNEGVDLAIESGVASAEPQTVGQMFQDTLRNWPTRQALMSKENGVWNPVTYEQYYANCLGAAKSFKKLGLEKFGAVCIIGFNAAEWFYSNMGAIFAGGLPAGIYTTNGPEACRYVADDCKANIIVVENQKQLDKILQIRDSLPNLKAIVQYKGKLSEEYKDVYDWEQFMKVGEDVPDSEIEDSMKEQKPNDAALLIYTSGTTGNPKGVMLSHDNLTWTAYALLEHESRSVQWTRGMTARIITYLPLSHIAGQMADIYLPLHAAATVYFAQPDALKGTLKDTMVEVKPTLFFGVPRVYEKFKEAMQEASSAVTGLKKKLGQWATGKAFQGNVNIQNKRSVPWGWTLANALVLDKVKGRIGLQDYKILHVGAAPIHRDVLEHFMKYNMPVLELYGMSENTGPAALNTIDHWRLGSVGRRLVGTKVKIFNVDEEGEGEICMYGRHVCMGYLNNEEKTKEAIDDEGWLHSGDIGKVDKDGYIFITGRIKELIITSGGENIAPVPIEARIKAAVPFLSNVMLIGDKRKYLTCLVTIKCVMDPDSGEPKDEIIPQAIAQLRAIGCELTTPSEVAQQKVAAVMEKIQAGLDAANKDAVSNAQKVQRFAILEKDFSLPGEELGPTLKLKRRIVVKKYEAVIDEMYSAPAPQPAKPKEEPAQAVESPADPSEPTAETPEEQAPVEAPSPTAETPEEQESSPAVEAETPEESSPADPQPPEGDDEVA